MSETTQEYINKTQDERLKCLEGHIETLNGEMGKVQICMAEVKANMRVLLWFMFAILGGIITLYFK